MEGAPECTSAHPGAPPQLQPSSHGPPCSPAASGGPGGGPGLLAGPGPPGQDADEPLRVCRPQVGSAAGQKQQRVRGGALVAPRAAAAATAAAGRCGAAAVSPPGSSLRPCSTFDFLDQPDWQQRLEAELLPRLRPWWNIYARPKPRLPILEASAACFGCQRCRGHCGCQGTLEQHPRLAGARRPTRPQELAPLQQANLSSFSLWARQELKVSQPACSTCRMHACMHAGGLKSRMQQPGCPSAHRATLTSPAAVPAQVFLAGPANSSASAPRAGAQRPAALAAADCPPRPAAHIPTSCLGVAAACG